MFQDATLRAVAVFAAMMVCDGAAARHAAPIAGEAAYIASVEVIQHDASAAAGFTDALRETVIREAVFYGKDGQPITLRIELDRLHYKNPVGAMLIGDDNRLEGRVAVVDVSGGQEIGSFPVEVDAERSGDFAAEIALGVVGAFDPTGAVDITTTVGQASSAEINRSGTEAAMIENFADETFRRTFGDDRAKAAHEAMQDARTPAR